MPDHTSVTTFLFSDIEGSTRLWEREPERMRPALAHHDAIARKVVEDHRGEIVKMTGDGMCAAFGDPVDALQSALAFQHALADPSATEGIALSARCGMHVGVVEHRDGDYFGRAMNRASRIMAAAHGGQILASQALAALIGERLPSDVALKDLGSVRLRDLASPEHVFQVLHPQLRVDFPALRTLEASPNNLPQQMTSFIGRERELDEVEGLLRKTRLLTLFGAGGLGKTRLSLQVASDAMDDYPDGVWFIELAPLTDARMVPQALASVLGVKEGAGRPVTEALARHVKELKLLLILDNCEHLIEACAELAMHLLSASVHVKILASSREHLHVTGEMTYQLSSLAVPEPGAKLPVAALTQYEAVHLFVDRASAAHPSFLLTTQNATAVIEICRRLDGIPLALELAAARVRALSVDKIAERLSDRFRLLTGGDRTALPRQQTLRASIDWSYDLLAPRERALLRRLSVFAGGLTLEAAEAVGSGTEIDEADVLDILTQLIEKSLVEVDAEGGRYRLLETVRQYAQEKLMESGEEPQVRTKHLRFFLDLAGKARPKLAGPEQGMWLARIDLELENILSAHAWCDHAESGAELGLKLTYLVKPYWFIRGMLATGHRVTIEALARPGAEIPTVARSTSLCDAGQMDCWMGRYDEARVHLGESLAIARKIGDRRMVAAVLQPLGIAAQGQGETEAARKYLEEALVLARDLGNKRELLAALNALAQLHRAEGELDAADPLYEKMLALARELGDRESIAIGLLNLAMVSIGRGSADRAGAMLLEVIAIVDEIGSRPAGQSVLEVSAGLASLRRDFERSARFFGSAEAETERTGLHRDPTDDAFLEPLIANARQAMGEARFAALGAAGRALTYGDALIEARLWLSGCA